MESLLHRAAVPNASIENFTAIVLARRLNGRMKDN